jgi:DNA helicase-2/ATP-dependent DNA helicase PcrA
MRMLSAPDVAPEILQAMGVRSVTEEQWAAISMPLEPFVLVAGAGSGKTSVMAARVVYLALAALGRIAAPGVLPGNVLCLTFTNKATENLQTRVRSALSAIDLQEGEEPEVANYHGFAASLLERYGMLAGIEPGQRVLTAAQRSELCARVLDRMTFEHVKAEWQPSVIDKILDLNDQAQNHLVSPKQIVDFNHRRLEELKDHKSDRAYRSALERLELARAAGIYRQLKRELGVIDFGDQIEMALRIVEEHPEVSAEYRSRFGAVLLDEYQDTNVAQARLLHAAFGDGHPVTAVGDPDQNIYAWRGASLFNLLDFPELFRKADGSPSEKLPLYTNFRSGSRILAAADTVIEPLPASQRPDPDKTLVPWEPNGDGSVQVIRQPEELSEAGWIGDRAVEVHSSGTAWSQIAVLCRTSRLFEALQRAFTERDVPVEVVGLAGLLRLPEVVEVLAYARAAIDPLASVPLARILMGPRYRVGFRDLALVAALAKDETRRLISVDEDEAEATPFLFAEALERLDEVEGLSEEGRRRLERCRDELRGLRAETRRPVGEFFAELIRRIGILTELDAALDRPAANAIERNLSAFLDEIHAFEPVEGDLTLRAFLDYVDAAERLDKQEWAPVQPSDQDSVKVMTIHVAKGLEFDTVFVPGLAHGILPNPEIPQNPAERGKSLDFELREDARHLPRYDGRITVFREELKAQEIFEERRTAYVAMTRARQRLFLSGSHWYGENVRAKGASRFLDELLEWGERTGLAETTRGDDAAEVNPMLGMRARFVREWPGPALREEADDLFPRGWRRAAAEAVDEGTVPDELVTSLAPQERTLFETYSNEKAALARHLVEREAVVGAPAEVPAALSVSGVITYMACPKRFFWTSVMPLPRFSGAAARIGTEIHRWIERRSSGQVTLLELEDEPDLALEELAGAPGKTEKLKEAFLASRFGSLTPLAAERAFLLSAGGFVVGGRIDAIFGEPDGPWEVVDWKTGKPPDLEDPLAQMQLDIYGLACTEVWGMRPSDLKLTYLYLAEGTEISHPMPEPASVRKRLEEALTKISERDFVPAPGPACSHCDFRTFCPEGSAWLSEQAG